MPPEEIARLKNLLICTWIGSLYGLCAAVVADSKWPVVLLIVVVVSGSTYLGVGRRWLQLIAPAVLFITLLGLVGLLPSPDDLRDFAHHPLAWLRKRFG